MIIGTFDTPLGPLVVANTHLSFVPGWGRRQLLRVRSDLAAFADPVVLMGDLNMPAPRPAAITGYRSLAEHPTFPVDQPDRQLDHILLRGRLGRVAGSRAPGADAVRPSRAGRRHIAGLTGCGRTVKPRLNRSGWPRNFRSCGRSHAGAARDNGPPKKALPDALKQRTLRPVPAPAAAVPMRCGPAAAAAVRSARRPRARRVRRSIRRRRARRRRDAPTRRPGTGPVDRCLGPAETGHRAEHQLLVQLRRAAVDRAADQVGVRRLAGRRASGRAGRRPGRAKPGASRSTRALHDARTCSATSSVGQSGRAGHVGVGPGRLGARRRPGRVGGGHLPEQHERPPRASGRRSGRRRSRRSRRCRRRGARCRRRGRRRRASGIGAAQRPVDLERRVVPLEPVEIARQTGGQVPRRRPVRGRASVPATSASTARPRADPRRRRRSRTPAARPPRDSTEVDRLARCGLTAAGDASRAASASASCRAPPSRHREADVLAEHRQQPAEQRRCRRRPAGRSACSALPASSSGAAGAGERLARRAGGPAARPAGRARSAPAVPSRPQQLAAGPDRRERGEQRVQQRDPGPAASAATSVQPGGAVAGGEPRPGSRRSGPGRCDSTAQPAVRRGRGPARRARAPSAARAARRSQVADHRATPPPADRTR